MKAEYIKKLQTMKPSEVMKKQFRCEYESWWKKRLYIYHDGKLIESKSCCDDEIDYQLIRLAAEGYVCGYTKEEVEEAKKRYEHMLENIIKD